MKIQYLIVAALPLFSQPRSGIPGGAEICDDRGEWLRRATHIMVGRTEKWEEQELGTLIQQRVTIQNEWSLVGRAPMTVEFVHFRQRPLAVHFGRSQTGAVDGGERAIYFLRADGSGAFRSVCDFQEPFLRLGPEPINVGKEVGRSTSVVESVLRLRWRSGDPNSLYVSMSNAVQVFGKAETALAAKRIVQENDANGFCLASLRSFSGLGFRCSEATDWAGPSIAELRNVDQRMEGLFVDLFEKSDWDGLKAFGVFREGSSERAWRELLSQHPNQKLRSLAQRARVFEKGRP